MNLRKIYKYCLPVTAVIILLLMAGCTDSSDRQSDSQIGIVDLQLQQRQMPSFNLQSPLSENSNISSDSLKGKVLLVSFFSSWCQSCLEEIPLLNKLQNKFSDQGFVLIAIAIDQENKVGLKNLIQKRKINYPVLLAEEATRKDFGGISILPTMFLVNREGIILKKYFGHIDHESLVQGIKQTLKN
jgi:thiol-disulfide isomerase/thioredoxin